MQEHERRKFIRIDLDLPVKVIKNNVVEKCMMRNISGSGVSVMVKKTYQTGEKVNVVISPHGEEELVLEGVIVWQKECVLTSSYRDHHFTGITFTKLDKKDQDYINRLVLKTKASR